MGALLIVRGIVQQTRRRLASVDRLAIDPPARRYRRGWVDAGCILGSIVFYLLIVDLLGFLTTVSVMSTLLITRLGSRFWVALVAGLVSTVAIWAIFHKVLMVPLPLGFWS
jgi:putative tricarboxylic transport membrane protein